MRHMLLNTSEAAECLRQGQVIAYPTEAVYGLGCDPGNENAVNAILSLKQRPASAGLILIAGSFEQFAPWVAEVSTRLLERASRTWPGPVTWLFPKHPRVPEFISGAHDTIAIRVTDHEPCIKLSAAFGGPVVSTSANPHSSAPASCSGEVEEYFGSYLAGILAGPLGGGTATSEIRDLATGEVIRGSA